MLATYETQTAETGTWIVRNIPSDLMRLTRMAALAERSTAAYRAG